jgi:hypothetical protein
MSSEESQEQSPKETKEEGNAKPRENEVALLRLLARIKRKDGLGMPSDKSPTSPFFAFLTD